MGTSQLLFQVKIFERPLVSWYSFTPVSLTLQPPFGNVYVAPGKNPTNHHLVSVWAARENELCARVATALDEGSASLKALETEAGCQQCKHPS